MQRRASVDRRRRRQAAEAAPRGARARGLRRVGQRVEMLDTNSDGKPDIRRVFDKRTGREICRVVGPQPRRQAGPLRVLRRQRRTSAAASTATTTRGVVNAIEHYEGGRLAEARVRHRRASTRSTPGTTSTRALPLDPKTGRPVHPSRRERDTKGDGRVDQWWTWDGDKVTIARRHERATASPIPASTVVLDEGGGDVDAGAPGAGRVGAVDAATRRRQRRRARRRDAAAAATPPPKEASGEACSLLLAARCAVALRRRRPRRRRQAAPGRLDTTSDTGRPTTARSARASCTGRATRSSR